MAMLAIVLPSVAFAITQQFPEAEYWWAALVTAIIGGIVKGIQVWLAQNKAPGVPPAGLAMEAPPEKRRGILGAILAD